MKKEKIFLGIGAILVFALGGVMGGIGGYSIGITQGSSFEWTSFPEETLSTLRFSVVENGIMEVSNSGPQARIIIPEGEITVLKEEVARLNMESLLPMMKKLPAPEWAQFVASKRGKKYWPLDAPQAFTLSVRNRVFYASEEDARLAGKEKGE